MLIRNLTVHLFLSFALLTTALQNQPYLLAKIETSNKSNDEASQTFKQKAALVIEKWQKEVAKDEQFVVLAQATYEIQPLGPGTHAYLVTFYDKQAQHKEPLGYLILQSSEAGALFIGEYGKGLFEGLHELNSSPLTTIYIHPFETIYIDEDCNTRHLLTNENYPLNLPTINKAKKQSPLVVAADSQLNSRSSFNYVMTIPYFSPYEKLSWLTSKAINSQLLDDRSIETELEFEQQLYYRNKSWANKISTVYAITSLHKWNDNQLFLGLQLDDEDSIRYIPYSQLLELGLFYSS